MSTSPHNCFRLAPFILSITPVKVIHMSLQTAAILHRAFTLVPTHGFSRQTLALAGSSSVPPLSSADSDTNGPVSFSGDMTLKESSITALFGPGDDARRTLIRAWLADAVTRTLPTPSPGVQIPYNPLALKTALKSRLVANTPVLPHLTEAFALLATPDMRVSRWTIPVPPLVDPRPGLEHAWAVAHHACLASGLGGNGTDWYTKRAAIAGIYAASELHQIASPTTAQDFMSDLVDRADAAASFATGIGAFGDYFARSWKGIIRSSGAF